MVMLKHISNHHLIDHRRPSDLSHPLAPIPIDIDLMWGPWHERNHQNVEQELQTAHFEFGQFLIAGQRGCLLGN